MGKSMRGDASVGLFVQARMVASYRFVEARLFEILGGWVADEPTGEARLFFDAQSRQHAWHAQLFDERLPVFEGFDPDEVTGESFSAVSDVLDRLRAQGETLVRLAGLGRLVLPRLVTGYTVHIERAADVADASLVRALRLVLRDESESWQECEALVQAFLAHGMKAGELARQVGVLEDVLMGGGPGLVPWPGAWSSGELGS